MNRCTHPDSQCSKAVSINDSITVASSNVAVGSSFQIFPPPSIEPILNVGTVSGTTAINPIAVGLFVVPPGLN